MKTAQQLKQQNIAEYLIYMWQVEDLLRANACDIDQMKEKIVSLYPEQERAELTEWYSNLATMMRQENVYEKGHLQISRNVIINLTELHRNLLASPQYPFYSGAYFKALPFIVELRHKNKQKEEPELETCFEALYGIMLLRLQQKPIGNETTKAVEAITNLLSMLANYYDKDIKGELKLN